MTEMTTSCGPATPMHVARNPTSPSDDSTTWSSGKLLEWLSISALVRDHVLLAMVIGAYIYLPICSCGTWGEIVLNIILLGADLSARTIGTVLVHRALGWKQAVIFAADMGIHTVTYPFPLRIRDIMRLHFIADAAKVYQVTAEFY